MAIPSIYINLEDDVPEIVTRLKRTSSPQLILVCPKRCHLFNDPDKLKNLKAQTDLLSKEVFILTMDEKGQEYARSAGFPLKFLPKAGGSKKLSDIKFSVKQTAEPKPQSSESSQSGVISGTVNEIKNIAKKFVPESLQVQSVKKPEIVSEPQKYKNTIPKIQVQDSFFPKELEEEYKKQDSKSHTPKVITGVVALSLLLILALEFVVLPKAAIVVYARSEPVTRDMEISISPNILSADPSKLVMPGIKIDEAATVSDNFQSQGKQQVGNKSGGSVRIFNFTKQPLNLKAQTTTLNVNGKSYQLVNDVLGLKPTTYKNAKIKEVDPNSLADPVEILAAQGGEDYNLPAGTRIEITNHVFGSKPQLLYAKTESEINGGTTRYLSLITQDDALSAQSELTKRAVQQIREKLKSSGLVLPDGSYSLQVAQFTTDNPVGAQTPQFHASLQVKVSGIAFKQDEMTKLINERIEQTLASNKTLVPKKPESTTISIKSFDLNTQLSVLNVHFEGQAVYDINLPDISTELVGKTQTQANEILRSKAEIDRVDITLAPVWQKSLPWFASKIKVNIAVPSQDPQ